VEVRAGVHTGEVQIRGDDIGGIAVHFAARVMAAAGPGEILVSRTVHDLIAGSDYVLEDRGAHTLKGMTGEWRLFAVRA
jgi:class 3 adenylate cyclase